MGCGATRAQAPPAEAQDPIVQQETALPMTGEMATIAAPSEEPLRGVDADAASDWDAESVEEGGCSMAVSDPSKVVQPSRYAAARNNDALVLLGRAASEAAELNVALICSHCGQPALRFPASRWAETVDYFHFRNYAPDSRMPERKQDDLLKLCTKLEPDETAAAYACGCSWQTIRDEKDIGTSGRTGSTLAAPHGGAPGDGDQILRWRAAG